MIKTVNSLTAHWEGREEEPWVGPFGEYYAKGKKNEADLIAMTRNIFKTY